MRSPVGRVSDHYVAVMETQMPAFTKNEKRPEKDQTREPAKGGITPTHKDAYPSGDSPKPHGDPLRHVIEEQEKK